MSRAFATPDQLLVLTEEETAQLEKTKAKIQCACEKDPYYKFGCKESTKWFANTMLQQKILRKYQEELEKQKKQLEDEKPVGETPTGQEKEVDLD